MGSVWEELRRTDGDTAELPSAEDVERAFAEAFKAEFSSSQEIRLDPLISEDKTRSTAAQLRSWQWRFGLSPDFKLPLPSGLT